MKTITGVIFGAVLVIVVIMGVLSYQDSKKSNDSTNLIIGITDATAEISNVNDIDLSIKKIEVYSKTNGWVTVSSDSKSYKLLTLHSSGKTELYAKARISEGVYEKIRVSLGDVIIKTKSKGDMKATLPSQYIAIDSNLKVKSDQISTLKLDILADQSLHTTVDNEYVFTPVVKSESKSNASISISNDNYLEISSGNLDSSTTVGVDFNGVSKTDFKAQSDSSLKIESSMGVVKFILGGKVYQKDDVSGNSDLKVNVDKSSNIDIKSKESIELNNNLKDKTMDVNLKGGIKIN